MIAGPLAIGGTSWHRRVDVVVIGTGAAGLSAALTLLEGGARVAVITKSACLGDGSTAWAQGGLAAVLDPADGPLDHMQDTLEAGAGLGDASAAAELVAAAPEAIGWLARRGARFDRDRTGALALGLEGGHHARRIVHAGGDASGAEVARVLAVAVRRAASDDRRAALLERTLAVDALTDAHGSVRGVRVIGPDGAVGELRAGAVVLATGGLGHAWPVTSNPATATGDGLALALRAGAVVADIEFVQFHPTVLVVDADHRRVGDRGVLISEAVRGEGARLRDVDGGPIMDGVHPLGDLAPRDVVAAEIARRMAATGADRVLLDATDFGTARWAQRFPTILALCLARGVDPRVEPIPVAPAAHYACGGVDADLDGVTSVAGLYAVGEVAGTGVHGANRLASNSLTEAVIAGRRVAERLLGGADLAGDAGGIASGGPGARGGVVVASAPGARRPLAAGLRGAVVAATGRGCGVLRDGSGLRAQLAALEAVGAEDAGAARAAGAGGVRAGGAVPAAGSGAESPGTLRARVETTNLHTISALVATAALRRTESRGCHRRADFPDPRPEWAHRVCLALDADGVLGPVAPSIPVAA